MSGQYRSPRCLPSSFHSMGRMESPLVISEWSSIQIYMSPIRLGYISQAIHKVPAGCGPAFSVERCQAPCLPGRLAYLRLIPHTGRAACWFRPLSATAPRLGYQHLQVWIGTQPGVRVYQHSVPHTCLHCSTLTQNAVEGPEYSWSLDVQPFSVCWRPPSLTGHGHSCTWRSLASLPNPLMAVRWAWGWGSDRPVGNTDPRVRQLLHSSCRFILF